MTQSTIVRSVELAEFTMSIVEQTLTDSSTVYDVHISFIDSPTIELACVSSDYADALFAQLEHCVDIRPIA